MKQVRIIGLISTKSLPENTDECHGMGCINCAAKPFITADDMCCYGHFLSAIDGKLDIKGE